MKIGAIIQARMSSQRLPGKVLCEVADKPLLQYLVERLARAKRLTSFVVATSTEASDTPVAAFCQRQGIECYRGELNNVIRRFEDVVDQYGFDVFVRVSGDSPLLDQRLVDLGVELLIQGGYEIVTNVMPRSYPPGQSVEVLRADTFKAARDLATEAEDLEHITRCFYRHRTDFRLFNFSAAADYTDVHLAVDTARDLEVFTTLITSMDRPHWQYAIDEIVQLYRRVIQPTYLV